MDWKPERIWIAHRSVMGLFAAMFLISTSVQATPPALRTAALIEQHISRDLNARWESWAQHNLAFAAAGPNELPGSADSAANESQPPAQSATSAERIEIAEITLAPVARMSAREPIASAARTHVTRHTAWATVCVEQEEPGPAACRLETRLQDARTRQTLFRWQIGYAEDGRVLSVAQTPNGVLLSAGLELELTDIRATRLPFSTCSDSACESAFFMEDRLIDTLSARAAVSARFVTADGRPIELAVSMDGFASALGQLTP
jgi:invasion protein IalB